MEFLVAKYVSVARSSTTLSNGGSTFHYIWHARTAWSSMSRAAPHVVQVWQMQYAWWPLVCSWKAFETLPRWLYPRSSGELPAMHRKSSSWLSVVRFVTDFIKSCDPNDRSWSCSARHLKPNLVIMKALTLQLETFHRRFWRWWESLKIFRVTSKSFPSSSWATDQQPILSRSCFFSWTFSFVHWNWGLLRSKWQFGGEVVRNPRFLMVSHWQKWKCRRHHRIFSTILITLQKWCVSPQIQ